MKPYLRLLILTALICCLSVEAHPALSTQSYLFKNSVLKSQPIQYTPFLLSQQPQDSTSVKNTKSLKLKSPYMAIFYSFIPGIVFHGAGHIYAGKIGTGLLLFGSGIVGAGLFTIGSIDVVFSQMENSSPTWKPGYVLMATGSIMFIGSWFYDLIGSPLAVQKRNRELLQNNKTELKFQLKDKDLRLAIVWHF
jgi:TM2 domain-containing membrane protein YozV